MKARVPNPRMIILARESRGLTQAQLKEKMHVSQVMISKVEHGVAKPSEDLLNGLSQHLRYPKSFFFEPGYQYPPVAPFHRKRQALPKRLQAIIEAEANVRRLHILKLLNSVNFPESSLPKLDLDDYGNDPCCVAQAIRRHLRLPRGPIDNLVNVLEDAGIIIILADFGTQLIDGFALLTNGAPPLIFVNSNMPMDRIRYSLCHELGHIILHTIPHPNIEKEANLFAAEFLAPAEEIGPYLDNMSLDTVASLKPYWKMAMSALIVRAKHLGKLDDNQYRYLWMKMNSLGFMRREPVQLDLPYEEPTLLQEILDTHLNELNYTVPEMCKMLMIYEDDFRRWYLPNKKENHLKIVK